MWNPLRAAGPMIRDGLLRVWMIDLKGGTETDRGPALFHRWATTVDDAIDLLTEFRDTMLARQARMRDRRCAAATSARDAVELLMIDELAMLTAYGDRSLVREALRLLAEILTQGRAADHGVAGYVQEPSKDVVDVRELFDTSICLGVTAASHVDMALGDGARDKGALADEIPGDPEHAGIGFAIAPGSRLPVRLRAGWSPTPTSTNSCAPAPPAPYRGASDGRRGGTGRATHLIALPAPERRRRRARGGVRVMTTRDLTAGRTREANTITAVLAAPCGLACAGTVIPGLDQAVTLVLLALAALALAAFGLRYTTRWVRERAEDRPTPTPRPHGGPSTRRTCSPPPTAPTSPHVLRRSRPPPVGGGRDVAGHPVGADHVAAHHGPARPRRRRRLAVVPARLVPALRIAAGLAQLWLIRQLAREWSWRASATWWWSR